METGTPVRSEVGGYILAGGRSSRMGRDKALLELAGRPLIAHAVAKLRRICANVNILSNNPALAAFAPFIPDIHPNCGPIGGLEAALAHSAFDWNLFVPVDVPFLPTVFLDTWVRNTLADEKRGVRIALFTIDGIPQPTLLLIHRDATLYIAQAIQRGEFRLFPVLEAAGRNLSAQRNLLLGRVFQNPPWGCGARFSTTAGFVHGEAWRNPTDAQLAALPLWFANLNTPADFAEAERHTDALDT